MTVWQFGQNYERLVPVQSSLEHFGKDFFLHKVGNFSASRDTAVGGRMIGHMNDDEEDYDESGQNWGSQ